MRMWMVEPKILCRKHLLGEHLECHMFIGTLRKQYSVSGYIEHNLMEPLSLFQRHERLVAEMERRGMKHKSPIDEEEFLDLVNDIPDIELYTEIGRSLALQELLYRCPECRERYELWRQKKL